MKSLAWHLFYSLPDTLDVARPVAWLLALLALAGLWHLLYSVTSFERRKLTEDYDVEVISLRSKVLRTVLATLVFLLVILLPLRTLAAGLGVIVLFALLLWVRQVVVTQKRFEGKGPNPFDLELLKKYVVMIDQDGVALNPRPYHHFGHWFGIAPDFDQLPKDAFKAYVNDILQNMESTKGSFDEVVFFVHGGLNDYKNALLLAEKRLGPMRQDRVYPVFILWRSGLIPCYWSHLTQFIQGKTHVDYLPGRILLFFANVMADIGRGVSRYPKTIYYQARSEFSAVYPLTNSDARNIPRLYHALRVRDTSGSNAFQIKRDRVDEETFGEFNRAALVEMLSPLKFAFRYAVWPLIDALGTSAWDIMLRRAYTLFRSPFEFDMHARPADAYAPEPHDSRKSLTINTLDSAPTGALSIFIREYMRTVPYDTTLIGHSMGTIVVNNWLSMYPTFKAGRIVYMAAACTIQHAVTALVPHLDRFPQSTFYNLTLHERAEKTEQHAFGLSPMGSLLEWIDNYFSKPLTFDQRTLGKWDNIAQATHLFPHSLRERITIKSFPVAQESHEAFIPTKHGDFSLCRFWQYDFYVLGSLNFRIYRESASSENEPGKTDNRA